LLLKAKDFTSVFFACIVVTNKKSAKSLVLMSASKSSPALPKCLTTPAKMSSGSKAHTSSSSSTSQLTTTTNRSIPFSKSIQTHSPFSKATTAAAAQPSTAALSKSTAASPLGHFNKSTPPLTPLSKSTATASSSLGKLIQVTNHGNRSTPPPPSVTSFTITSNNSTFQSSNNVLAAANAATRASSFPNSGSAASQSASTTGGGSGLTAVSLNQVVVAGRSTMPSQTRPSHLPSTVAPTRSTTMPLNIGGLNAMLVNELNMRNAPSSECYRRLTTTSPPPSSEGINIPVKQSRN